MVTYSFYESDTRILQYTRALVERGDSVDVLSLRRDGAPRFEVVDGVRVSRIRQRTVDESGPLDYLGRILLFLFAAATVLARRQFSRRYDVVHVHSVPDFLVFAAIVPKLFGARIVLDIHDILPEFCASKFGAQPASFLFRTALLCEKISAAFADHVIVANELWMERLASRSVRADKCTAIRNYPDPRLFFPRPRVARPGRFLILYPGSLNRHQGLDVAIRAFAKVASQMPNAEFCIYGDGSEQSALIDLARSLGLDGRVSINPSLPLEQIVEIMAQADLAVVPKRASSTFGNEAASTKIMEFMALGVPVVVSRTRIDSFYHDDSMVRFVEPENTDSLAAAMLQLWRDEALRQRLAANALQYVEANSWMKRKFDYLATLEPAGPASATCTSHTSPIPVEGRPAPHV
jgi:glycosyltransferase involved in cell wall biosynthesis